ncbi:MAG: amidohydrolase family protein [bacterium]|nr:amidohydrolase family protein [bacterium]
MSDNGHLSAAEIRSRLTHPIIDADGHWLEYGPVMTEQLRRIGGDKAAEGFSMFRTVVAEQLAMSVEERRQKRIAQPAWWASPTKNTHDRATAMMPRLLYERLDEFGIDFAVLYPTSGLAIHRIPDAETRRATCRAFNIYCAETFGDFANRMTPAAVIPMFTPEEAIEELTYVKHQLGLKVILTGSLMRRPIPAIAKQNSEMASTAVWYDVLGIDSDYDYDAVWSKCEELGFAPSFHSSGRGYAMRVSPSNFVYNHVGHFAAANEAVCKALFLGGVTRRFPKVNFAFLEGGVGWACQLFSDLIEHWEKRSLQGLEEVKPANLDLDLLTQLAETYANADMLAAIRAGKGLREAEASSAIGGITQLDDFAACEITQKTDLRDLFTSNFYFGCEADDRMNAWAFRRNHNPMGARLKALFGSDIGHFDVPNMAHVVPEAYQLVEQELMTDDDFRDFMLTNPVHFWGDGNADFFKGTVVEQEATAVLASS